MLEDTAAAENTDREIWREREGDYYSDSLFVTVQNGLGIDVGGTVFVKPLRRWQELAVENDRQRSALDRIMVAGNHLSTYSAIDGWPSYKLDGLTRAQQCEHALRSLGATWRYDMWIMWSALMQERDFLTNGQ